MPAVAVALVLVIVAERTECVAVLVEGVGEAARAVGVVVVYAGSHRGTSVRRSPVESTDGGLSGKSLIFD